MAAEDIPARRGMGWGTPLLSLSHGDIVHRMPAARGVGADVTFPYRLYREGRKAGEQLPFDGLDHVAVDSPAWPAEAECCREKGEWRSGEVHHDPVEPDQ